MFSTQAGFEQYSVEDKLALLLDGFIPLSIMG